MNGYFSRLIEQSVRPAGPTVGSARGVPARPQARIDLEEPVESRRDERIGGARNDPEAASEVSGPIIEGLVRGQADQTVHREVPEPPRRRPEDRRQLDARGSNLTLHRRAGDAGELPARVDAVEGEAGARRPVVSRRGALGGEAPASLPGEDPWDPAGRERVWRSAFEEVRGWVAGSPVADDEGAENRDAGRAVASVDADLPFVEERVATAIPDPAGPPTRDELETQDLRLEIGTISVTVEEPQRESPRSSRRTEVQEKEPAGKGERSRLSRHYVRVR